MNNVSPIAAHELSSVIDSLSQDGRSVIRNKFAVIQARAEMIMADTDADPESVRDAKTIRETIRELSDVFGFIRQDMAIREAILKAKDPNAGLGWVGETQEAR